MNIIDWDRFKEYLKVTPAIIAKFGGRHIARGGETMTLEGPEEKRRVVLIEFPSMEQAKKFYNSAEYQQARKLREGAAEGEMLALDGLL
ncbi:MAG: DUF1330 domain-containing protein [Proteobacteria bacterium]|nr:DUF1330 domain-containing protein [Pseudomonadota bacterium]MBU4294323.1 DUF1330 domain-containing protein [Pseudomonadota bacterium]MCG2749110.1 DUF1330 domain-containing protein [Desulfobulbaceae bacterium]